MIEYLEHGRLLEDPRVRADIKRRAPQFNFHDGMLFRRSYEGLFLRCLDKAEDQQIMAETHSKTCGTHQSGPKPLFRIKRMGYYWPTMVMDCLEHAKKCQACRFKLITSINLQRLCIQLYPHGPSTHEDLMLLDLFQGRLKDKCISWLPLTISLDGLKLYN